MTEEQEDQYGGFINKNGRIGYYRGDTQEEADNNRELLESVIDQYSNPDNSDESETDE